jgi:hypothetical protein
MKNENCFCILKLGSFDMGIHGHVASRLNTETFLSMRGNFIIKHNMIGKYTNLSRNILRKLRNET